MQIKELKTTIEDRDLDLISAKDALKYHQNRSRELKENIKVRITLCRCVEIKIYKILLGRV